MDELVAQFSELGTVHKIALGNGGQLDSESVVEPLFLSTTSSKNVYPIKREFTILYTYELWFL